MTLEQSPTSPAPPGWYGDPTGISVLRWWDGTAWTTYTAPESGTAVLLPDHIDLAGRAFILAGWWRRAGGLLLDGLIVSIPLILVQTLLGSTLYSDPGAFGLGGHPTAGPFARITLNVVALALELLYAVWLIGTRGQTVGMMAAGVIAIGDVDGNPLKMSKAWRRALVAFFLTSLWSESVFLSSFATSNSTHPNPARTALTLVGLTLILLTYLWPLGSQRNQTLQDKAVGSLIVLKNAESQL